MTTKTKLSPRAKAALAIAGTVLAIAGGVTTAVLLAEPQPTGVPGTWSLVFYDEFDQAGLSSAWWPCPIWYNCTQGGRTDQGVGAQGWFVGSAVTVPGDGYLHLTATKRQTPVYQDGQYYRYNTGYIITGRNSTGAQGQWFQYGAFEARMKCPAFHGAWCAFWTWGDRAGQSGFTYPNSSNEIDITENLSRHPLVQNMNLHGAATFGRTYQMTSPNTDWHIYTVEWQPGYIKFYVDGTLAATYTGNAFNSAWMYVIVSLQTGSSDTGWAGPVDESGMVNGVLGEMLVDYVRVWKSGGGTVSTATNTPASATLPRTATRTPVPPTATRTPAGYPTLGSGCWSLPGNGYVCVP